MFLICPCVFCLSVVLDCCLVLRIYMYYMYVNLCSTYIINFRNTRQQSSTTDKHKTPGQVRNDHDKMLDPQKKYHGVNFVVLYVHPPLMGGNSAPPAWGHVRASTRVILVAPCRWPENPDSLAVSSRAKLNAAVLGAQATSRMIFFV